MVTLINFTRFVHSLSKLRIVSQKFCFFLITAKGGLGMCPVSLTTEAKFSMQCSGVN